MQRSLFDDDLDEKTLHLQKSALADFQDSGPFELSRADGI